MFRKIKPITISKLNSMSLNNRLLQNYLDVSLISDGKVSSTSISKTSGNVIEKPVYRGPTPLRSSTSVENYPSSSSENQSMTEIGTQENFSGLSTFRISSDETTILNNNDAVASTNPYNSLSCMTMSEKLQEIAEEKMSTKLKNSVSSVGTQVLKKIHLIIMI